jgi:hypothetical protein
VVRLYRQLKVWINHWLDRVIDACSALLSRFDDLTDNRVESALRETARQIGDVCWLLRDVPRLTAYRLRGREWTIIFIGSERGVLEARHLLFAGQPASQDEIGRLALWTIPAQVRCWLADGVDLVVYESSRLRAWRPTASYAFTVPTWVHQVARLSNPIEHMLRGRRMHGVRCLITRAERNGFGYRFSRSKDEFDLFYHRMYVPFVRARHGERAIIAPYAEQFNRWFKRGGLLLVTLGDEPVAGVLCYAGGETCYAVEGGVLDNDAGQIQQGLNSLIVWAAMRWARERGARFLSMGHSAARRSNGAFGYKQRWRAIVRRQRRIHCVWTLLAEALPESLRRRLNEIGFISDITGKFYGVLIQPNGTSLNAAEMERDARDARDQGLSGIVLVSPNQHLTREARGPSSAH